MLVCWYEACDVSMLVCDVRLRLYRAYKVCVDVSMRSVILVC